MKTISDEKLIAESQKYTLKQLLQLHIQGKITLNSRQITKIIKCKEKGSKLC